MDDTRLVNVHVALWAGASVTVTLPARRSVVTGSPERVETQLIASSVHPLGTCSVTV